MSKKKPRKGKRIHTTRQEIEAANRIEGHLKRMRLKFTGEITDDLQRVCECNVTRDIMELAINNPLDWYFDVQAICDDYIEHEEKIFRRVYFNDLNEEVIAMQQRVRDSVNPKHLKQVVWFARLAKKGETL